jgi:hypothetical protein
VSGDPGEKIIPKGETTSKVKKVLRRGLSTHTNRLSGLNLYTHPAPSPSGVRQEPLQRRRNYNGRREDLHRHPAGSDRDRRHAQARVRAARPERRDHARRGGGRPEPRAPGGEGREAERARLVAGGHRHRPRGRAQVRRRRRVRPQAGEVRGGGQPRPVAHGGRPHRLIIDGVVVPG